jgi:hypothetical protein
MIPMIVMIASGGKIAKVNYLLAIFFLEVLNLKNIKFD